MTQCSPTKSPQSTGVEGELGAPWLSGRETASIELGHVDLSDLLTALRNSGTVLSVVVTLSLQVHVSCHFGSLQTFVCLSSAYILAKEAVAVAGAGARSRWPELRLTGRTGGRSYSIGRTGGRSYLTRATTSVLKYRTDLVYSLVLEHVHIAELQILNYPLD